ncbi:MAG: peptide deformylase [Rhodospirillaceae bacterium]|nr:peptide deformylase [Rhodospirillaceae bacterium]MCA8933797.1 peptide deformylase [Rhodospirillaceae bacterium]
MSLLKIARMGHPVLRRTADPVADPTDPAVAQLIADMVETMLDASGVGLAAPQVHVSRRIIVFQVPAARRHHDEPVGPDGVMALINPVVEPLGDRVESGIEGCLSIPELRGVVPRWAAIRYSGIGADGAPVTCEAHGFHARVVQHEVDHLDGVLYLDRMLDLRLLAFESELQYLVDEAATLAALDAAEGTSP